MKRIILHIGRPKTGTTALQAFFLDNRSLLLEHGVYYPMARPANPSWKQGVTAYGLEIESILRRHKRAKRKQSAAAMAEAEAALLESWSELRARAEEAACDSILISSEHLVGLDPKLLIPLCADDQVTVVCYLRRQDEAVQSAYIQHLRDSSIRFTRTIQELVGRPQFINRFDYFETLNAWNMAFGPDNIVVRVYDKKSLSGGIVQDFFKAIGLAFSEVDKIPKRTINPSIDQRAIVLLRFLNRVPMPKKGPLFCTAPYHAAFCTFPASAPRAAQRRRKAPHHGTL